MERGEHLLTWKDGDLLPGNGKLQDNMQIWSYFGQDIKIWEELLRYQE